MRKKAQINALQFKQQKKIEFYGNFYRNTSKILHLTKLQYLIVNFRNPTILRLHFQLVNVLTLTP